MARTATDPATRRWGTRLQAMQVLGLGERAVARMAERGQLTTRALPGQRLLYDLVQCRELAEKSTRVAVEV